MRNFKIQERRTFLRTILLAPAAWSFLGRASAAEGAPARVRFGVISDVHQDVMHDGIERIRAFVSAMGGLRADFVVQLGDFCQPKEANRPFLDAWNAFEGPRRHVLGNHDMDGGFKQDQTVAFYGMPGRYYTFDAGPFAGVVLDGNERGGKAKGYARCVAAEQMAWLKRSIAESAKPVMIFIHQPLDDANGLENGAEVRAILETVEAAKPGTVLAVLSGHLHEDYAKTIGGIAYVQINSASYVWLPASAAREVYAPAAHTAHPYLKQVAPYREPLWALVTVDLARGVLEVEGRASEWVGPDPWARGAGEGEYPRDRVRPAISARRLATPGRVG